MAGTMASHSITKLLPSIGTGLRRPDSSGSPSSILRHSSPDTLPFSAKILIGWTKKLNLIPSSLASSISTGSAGISASVRRPKAISRRKSIPVMNRSYPASSPSQRIADASGAPTPTKTALYPSFVRSSMVMSFPTLTP